MSEDKDIAVVEADPFMEMMERVATNQDIDADKMQKILDMQMQVMDREARDAFYVAMNNAQIDIPTVLPDSRNEQTNSDYAKLEAVSAAIKPVYTAHGFSVSVSQGKSDIDGYIRANAIVRHISGHSESYYKDFPPDKTGIAGKVNKTDIHSEASTFTYCRRYLVCGIFDVVVGKDTDGNTQSIPISEEQAANIEALLDETGADKVRFLKYAGADSVEEIDEKYYSTCVKMLEKKRAKA